MSGLCDKGGGGGRKDRERVKVKHRTRPRSQSLQLKSSMAARAWRHMSQGLGRRRRTALSGFSAEPLRDAFMVHPIPKHAPAVPLSVTFVVSCSLNKMG